MNKFMTWLANSFAPKCKTIFENPWIDAVASTMKKVLPFILTGSVISFYNVFKSYLSFLPDLGVVFNYTFGFLAIYITFLVTYEAMIKLKHEQYQIYASLTAIGLYFILCKSITTEDGFFQIIGDRIGASGIMMGLITGLLTSIIFHFYAKLHVLSDNDTIPDFVIEWINNIIPIGLTLLVGMILVNNLNLDIYEYIIAIFIPLQKIAQTLPGLILICLIQAMLYSMGISAWIFNAVTTPIFMMAISENIQAVANGGMAVNITTSETVFTAALITMGGVGATLPLNALMLKSKSKKLKTMGSICIAPSLFNINEPLMFGAPVVFNPLLMLPMWINNIIGPVVIWITMKSGFLNIPSKMIQVGQIPAPFSSVMITEDLRAVIVYIILFVLYMFVWYPFYKVYEKKCLEEEMQLG